MSNSNVNRESSSPPAKKIRISDDLKHTKDCEAVMEDIDVVSLSSGLRNLTTRKAGSLCQEGFTACQELFDYVSGLNILIIGAGGLGCELVKNLALLGFRNIHLIDMDTIDLSNLNRQFLFRTEDIGRSKAEVAAEAIMKRVPQCKITPHYRKIEDYGADFYQDFQIIISGLDSIVARRWMNSMLMSLLKYDDDGKVIPSSTKPFIDGGTEGFKGHVRVIYPGISACYECTMDLFDEQRNFPLCTIAHTPRLPEHCVEYVRILLWPKENPFGPEDFPLDGDNPEHILWVFDKSLERAKNFKISGVTYRLTQGVIKNIVPAVASTNAIIAAACATEVLKCASFCYKALDNSLIFNQTNSVYTYAYNIEKNEDCLVCSHKPIKLTFSPDDKLEKIEEYLRSSKHLQMRSPAILSVIGDERKTLYMKNIASIEEHTRANLKKSLAELGFIDNQELVVTDPSAAMPYRVIVKLE